MERTPRPVRPLRRLLLALPLVLAACASTGSGASADAGREIRIAVSDGRGGILELVSESHTSPVELYSKPRSGASRKVQADEVLAAFVERLDDHGFSRRSSPGRFARGGGTLAIEVEEDGAVRHWVAPAERARRERFQQAWAEFIQLYNITQAYQTIENEAGGQYFESRRPGGGG